MKFTEQHETETFEKCIQFLNDIGIKTSFRAISDDSFLPGLLIENGNIVIDTDSLKAPGDILHEAGHIAVVPAKDRRRLTAEAIIDRREREAEEVMAIAWSYAACEYLMIDPSYVFHEAGYRGGSSFIMESCSKNEYMGTFMLRSLGMVSDGPYPNMIKWLRD